MEKAVVVNEVIIKKDGKDKWVKFARKREFY